MLVLALLCAAASLPARAAAADAPTEAQRCMALTLYFEARGEGRDGMLAVGHVVLNRIASEDFPDTPCAVVREGGETPPCQFSWWCDGLSDWPQNNRAWWRALKLAIALLDGRGGRDPTDGALFFHHDGVDAAWHRRRERTVQIGRHVYYR